MILSLVSDTVLRTPWAPVPRQWPAQDENPSALLASVNVFASDHLLGVLDCGLDQQVQLAGVLALPFGHGVFLWGEPIEIERDLDEAGLERARLLVEARMNELAAEADRRVGHGDALSAAALPGPMGFAGKERR